MSCIYPYDLQKQNDAAFIFSYSNIVKYCYNILNTTFYFNIYLKLTFFLWCKAEFDIS